MSSMCPHNMANFGPLAAEIDPVVWGTPTNLNRFCILAALLHASSNGRQPNFVALNRGRHLCSAGRPSGWALAHILVGVCHEGYPEQNTLLRYLNILEVGLGTHTHTHLPV